jgi:hypothetical protein
LKEKCLRKLIITTAIGLAVVSPAVAAAGRGGGTSGLKVTVKPRTLTDTGAITASFRAPYRLKKGHKWGLWILSDCSGPAHPWQATGGWQLRAGAKGHTVRATFRPVSPGYTSMRGREQRLGDKWCAGRASLKVLDVTTAKHEARLLGSRSIRIRKTAAVVGHWCHNGAPAVLASPQTSCTLELAIVHDYLQKRGERPRASFTVTGPDTGEDHRVTCNLRGGMYDGTVTCTSRGGIWVRYNRADTRD